MMSLSKLVAGRLGLTSHSVRRITSYEGPSYDTVRDIRGTKLSPAMLTYYREPLLIHSGKMQYLYDHKGQEYLDMFGGIVTVSVGHCHPRVNEALIKQVNTLWHTTNIYLHPKVQATETVPSSPPGSPGPRMRSAARWRTSISTRWRNSSDIRFLKGRVWRDSLLSPFKELEDPSSIREASSRKHSPGFVSLAEFVSLMRSKQVLDELVSISGDLRATELFQTL